MVEPRAPFEEAVRHGWFAAVYWTALAVGFIAVVIGFAWGSVQQRIVTGYAIGIGLVLLIVGRYLIARRIRTQRDRARR